MKLFKQFCVLFFFLTACIQGTSQSRTEPMTWWQISERIAFNTNVSGLILVQKRRFLERPGTHQDLLWLSSGYRHKNVSFGGGLMYFTMTRFLDTKFRAVPEFRPFQYLTYTNKAPRSNWSYQLRAMIEQRLLSEVTGNEIAPVETLQIRYRLRCNMALNMMKNTTLQLSNEFLWLNTKQLAQNRALIELAHTLHAFRVSAGYMNWYVEGVSKPWRNCWVVKLDHQLQWPL